MAHVRQSERPSEADVVTERWFRMSDREPGEPEPRRAAAFDPVREGAAHGLTAEAARELWDWLGRTSRGDGGATQEEQLRRRFHELAVRMVRIDGRRHPDPGRTTRVEVEAGRAEATPRWHAALAPGRTTLVQIEARRWAGDAATETPAVEIDALPHRSSVESLLAQLHTARPHASIAPRHTAPPHAWIAAQRDAAQPPGRAVAQPAIALGARPAAEFVPDAPADRPLPDELRAAMERSFATDFSRVRYTETEAAREVGADAIAVGESLYFAPGRFDPGTVAGRAMIGHELGHVVQQRAGRVPSRPSGHGVAIHRDPALEAEADAAGMRAATGEAAGTTAARSTAGRVASEAAAGSSAVRTAQLSITLGAGPAAQVCTAGEVCEMLGVNSSNPAALILHGWDLANRTFPGGLDELRSALARALPPPPPPMSLLSPSLPPRSLPPLPSLMSLLPPSLPPPSLPSLPMPDSLDSSGVEETEDSSSVPVVFKPKKRKGNFRSKKVTGGDKESGKEAEKDSEQDKPVERVRAKKQKQKSSGGAYRQAAAKKKEALESEAAKRLARRLGHADRVEMLYDELGSVDAIDRLIAGKVAKAKTCFDQQLPVRDLVTVFRSDISEDTITDLIGKCDIATFRALLAAGMTRAQGKALEGVNTNFANLVALGAGPALALLAAWDNDGRVIERYGVTFLQDFETTCDLDGLFAHLTADVKIGDDWEISGAHRASVWEGVRASADRRLSVEDKVEYTFTRGASTANVVEWQYSADVIHISSGRATTFPSSGRYRKTVFKDTYLTKGLVRAVLRAGILARRHPLGDQRVDFDHDGRRWTLTVRGGKGVQLW